MDVALHLDQRDGTDRLAAVGEPDGVGRVLPALVGQAATGRVVVGDEAVAVPSDPAERRLQVRQQGADLLGGQTPTPRVAQQADPQRRRVDGAVVERREALCERGRGAAPLVQDLARLLARLRVGGAALRPCEGAQGAAREGDVVGQQERGRPEGVAAEQGEVPGRARAREDVAGVAGLGEQQGVEVGERAIEQRGQARVVGPHGVRTRRAACSRGRPRHRCRARTATSCGMPPRRRARSAASAEHGGRRRMRPALRRTRQGRTRRRRTWRRTWRERPERTRRRTRRRPSAR